eukprot:4897410-Amphidinium_carterae.1
MASCTRSRQVCVQKGDRRQAYCAHGGAHTASRSCGVASAPPWPDVLTLHNETYGQYALKHEQRWAYCQAATGGPQEAMMPSS